MRSKIKGKVGMENDDKREKERKVTCQERKWDVRGSKEGRKGRENTWRP